jgi:hypothetical protein
MGETGTASVAGQTATFGAGVALAVGVGFVLDRLEVGANVANGVGAAAFGVPPVLALQWHRMRKGQRQELVELGHGSLGRPPLLVVGLLAAAMVLVDSLFGAIAGAAGAVLAGADADADTIARYSGILSLFGAVPAFLVCAYFLARRATYYLARMAALWIAVAIIVMIGIRFIIIAVFAASLRGAGLDVDWVEYIVTFMVLAPIVYVVCLVGMWRATATRTRFEMGRLIRRLPKPQRATALESVRRLALVTAGPDPAPPMYQGPPPAVYQAPPAGDPAPPPGYPAPPPGYAAPPAYGRAPGYAVPPVQPAPPPGYGAPPAQPTPPQPADSPLIGPPPGYAPSPHQPAPPPAP